ncbi:hypothetical protein GCM10023215_41020 [Pseudonocardia yuanmonensis]|uniref:Uncharacterized protein n=1 Tax=Pseudonocardia yuanmonensis TaxID=1095914 RepID=A0ABP8X022_9PSEU
MRAQARAGGPRTTGAEQDAVEQPAPDLGDETAHRSSPLTLPGPCGSCPTLTPRSASSGAAADPVGAADHHPGGGVPAPERLNLTDRTPERPPAGRAAYR